MAWIEIDGIPLPTPVRCPITESDMDAASAGRSESGYMHRDVVRKNVIDLGATEWQHLTVEEAQIVRNALAPAAFTVSLRFVGGTITKTMYAGDRNWDPDFTDDGKERWNLTVHLIEV